MIFILLTMFLYSGETKTTENRYVWLENRERSGWSPCTASCGEGFTESLHRCFDIFGGEYVDVSFCGSLGRPSRRMKCGLRPCPKSVGYWYTSPWGRCSVMYGRGISSRLVACIQHNDTQILDDSMCPSLKPILYKVCEGRFPLKGRWVTGDWSKCSKICGSKRQRTVRCCKDGGKIIPDKYCAVAGKKPKTEERCESSCVRWIAGPWRKCKYNKEALSCMAAKQSRCVICIHKQSFEVSKGCDPITKPSQKRNCALQACSSKMVKRR